MDITWSFFNQFQKTIGVSESEKQALFDGPAPIVIRLGAINKPLATKQQES